MQLALIGGEIGFPGERLVEFREIMYRNGKKAGLERPVGRRAFHEKGAYSTYTREQRVLTSTVMN
jgi:hypothetical protein